MAVSITDRDSQYMKEMWGTTRLITDYHKQEDQRVLQEVVYDPAAIDRRSKKEIYENYDEENNFEYGIEPVYKLDKGQKLL